MTSSTLLLTRSAELKKSSSQTIKWQVKVDWRSDPRYIFYQRAALIMRRVNGSVNNPESVGFKTSVQLKEHLLLLWKKQQGKCFYTGEQMSLTGYPENLLAFTVDRITPDLGYVDGNIVLCCSIVNRIKQELSLDELLNWVNKINLRAKKLLVKER